MFCRPFQRMLAALLFLSLTPGAVAEIPPYRVKWWTPAEGLPQGRVACLKQTRDGYLWIGTWEGVARFDGMHFTVFNKVNTPELTHDGVAALEEDDEGTLWIATGDGLVYYREHRFGRLTTADGLPDHKVWRLARSSQGGLWVQSGSRIVRVVSGKVRGPLVRAEFDSAKILSITESADGSLQIFTQRGWLAIPAGGSELRTNYQTAPLDYWLTATAGSAPGMLWIGTADGVLTTGPNGLEPPQCHTAPSGCAVNLICKDRSSHFWVSAPGHGIYRAEHTNFDRINLGEGPPNCGLVCLEEGSAGEIWLGMDCGLVQFRTLPVRSFTSHDGLANESALTVCETADGVVWAGTEHGFSSIYHGAISNFTADIHQSSVRAVWPRQKGGVWLAFGEIAAFSDGKFTDRVFQSELPAVLASLLEDRNGTLWIGGNQLAMFRPDEGWPALLPGTDRVPNGISAIHQDRKGAMWFSSHGRGLACLQDGVFRWFTVRDGIASDNIWSIHEDPDDMLWLGTDKGLTRFSHGRGFSITPAQGLPESTVNCVLEDDLGHLWLSGMHGLHYASRAALNASAEAGGANAQWFTLGTDDGMASAESNGGENQPAGWKSRDGRLWFPTTRGVVVVDPKAVPLRESPPSVVIEQVMADEDVVYGSGAAETKAQGLQSSGHRIRAGHGNVLEFKYTANAFVAPEKARFQYRLLGVDQNWRQETERAAHYIKLRPGNYQFEVMAANHHNVWSAAPATFAFTLAPFFWQTWPFYATCIAAVVGLGAAVQAYRLRWQHRLLKLEEQRNLAFERTRIARELHDDLGTALTGLALELDVARKEANSSNGVPARLAAAARRTRELAQRMREVVWTVNPRCDTVSSLAAFLEQQVSQFLRVDGLRVHLDFPEQIPQIPLGADARHQLALSVREALTNVVRHANATEVVVRLQIESAGLLVQVKDNGRGIQPTGAQGQGLANMRARMSQIGGAFDCVSSPETGTSIVFRVPLPPGDRGELVK